MMSICWPSMCSTPFLFHSFINVAFFSVLRDYEHKPELDVYDVGDLDEKEYEVMDTNARKDAEKVMKKRDRTLGNKYGARAAGIGRIPLSLLQTEGTFLPFINTYVQFENNTPAVEDEEDSDQENSQRAPRRRRIFEQAAAGVIEDEGDDEVQ